jgi:hypothetical protein
MIRPDIRVLLPRRVDRYEGPRLAFWLLAAYNVVGTVRSLIHILAPDSGASSIAGMDVTVAGGANAIALLAQWGGAQLLMALMIWLVLWRYKGLVPLMALGSLLDNVLRVAIGQYKPLVTVHTPPGAVSWILIPALAVLLVVSLMPTRRREDSA